MKQPKNGGGGVFAGLKGLKWFSTEETLLHSGATEGLALSETLSNGKYEFNGLKGLKGVYTVVRV